jgi:signal transduction histidine kinase/CheY-like chemotaxis protein
MKNQFSKLWAISIVLVITFTALIYWGAKSYKESSSAIKRLIQPNSNTELLNSIFKFVYQSDLHFNNFILTNDTLQQRSYHVYTQKIDSSIAVLSSQFSLENDDLSLHIDSLKLIIDEKTALNNKLINLKKQQNSQFFVNEALNRIKNQLSDSTYIENLLTEQQELIVKQDTIDVLEVLEIPDDFRGISGFFRRLFGIENIRTDTVLSQDVQTRYNLAITEKRSVVRDYSKDSTLLVVKTILLDVLNDEIAFQKKLVDAELEMIVYNELLLQNIRKLLEDISRLNQLVLVKEQQFASEKIQTAHQSAFVVAGIGICLGLILLIFLFKDISRANLYRNRLEIEKERAEKLAIAKETFLSSMSHEIRTPLHSIAGLSQLLAKEVNQTGKAYKLINGIMYANQYLRELIENILEQAKINTGKYRIEYNPISIPALSRELKELFSFREMEQGNEFTIHYSEHFSSISILFDGIKLKQVLINLIGNAFKFTKQGDIKVNFSLNQVNEKHVLRIEVSDTGVGIDPRYHESIFEAFDQGNNVQHANVLHGTGLGLSISKHIITQSGGSIEVSSEPGKGSTFKIDLPVEIAHESNNLTEFEKKEWKTELTLPIRVLAVEDDEWNAFLIEEYVKPIVSELIVFNDAREAIPYFKEHNSQIDLILTDLNLPELNGIDFFKSIQTLSPLPVVALSASMSKQQRVELIKTGFADALGKPFTEQELRSVLYRLFTDSHPQEPKNEVQSSAKTSLIHSHIELFITFYKQKYDSFIQAIDKKDVHELAKLAHQLKSNVEQVGFHHLSEDLNSIEVLHSIGKSDRVLEMSEQVAPKLQHLLEQVQHDNLPSKP